MTINLRGISPEHFSKFLYIKPQKPHSCCHWLSQRIQVTWQRICFLFSHHEYIRATSLAKRVIHYAKKEKRTLDELNKVTPAFMQACLHIDSEKSRRKLVIEFAGYKEAAKTREEKASPKDDPTPTQQDIRTSEENTEPRGEQQTSIVGEPSQEDISETEPFIVEDTQETFDEEVLSENEADQVSEHEPENDDTAPEASSDHPQKDISETASTREIEEASDEEAPLDDEAGQAIEHVPENDDTAPEASSDHPQKDISETASTREIEEASDEEASLDDEANQTLEQEFENGDATHEAYSGHPQEGIPEITSAETEEVSDEEASLDDEANQTLEQEFENGDATHEAYSGRPQEGIPEIITGEIQKILEEKVLSEKEANQALEQALENEDEITAAFLDHIKNATILSLPSQYIPSIETLQKLHSRCQFKTVIFSCDQPMNLETFELVFHENLSSVQLSSIKAFLSLPLGDEKIKEFINKISSKEELLISAIPYINQYTDFQQQQDLLQLQKVFHLFTPKRLVEIILKRVDPVEYANALRALLFIYTKNMVFSSDQQVQAIFKSVDVEVIRDVIQMLEKVPRPPRVHIPLMSYYFIRAFSSIRDKRTFLENTLNQLDKIDVLRASFFIRTIAISTDFDADHSDCLMEFFQSRPESIRKDTCGMLLPSNREYVEKIIQNVIILRPEHLPFVIKSYVKHFSNDDRFISILEASLDPRDRLAPDNIKTFLKAFPQENGLRKQICDMLQERYAQGKGFFTIPAQKLEEIIQEVLST